MTQQETKLKRQEYLAAIIDKYTKTEPALTEREIAEVIVMGLGNINKLIQTIKSEAKKEKV